MDLYLYQTDYIETGDHHQEDELFYYDIGVKCFDCDRFSHNRAYHCKICDIGCLDGEIYEHCQKCNKCHKRCSGYVDYCGTCKKCVGHFNGRCVKCPLVCDGCGDSQPFDSTLRHCQQCSACYYGGKFRHCLECADCVNPKCLHCTQCGKCHRPDEKHCLKCNLLVSSYSQHSYCDGCDRCFDDRHCNVCHKSSHYGNHHGCHICGCVDLNFGDYLRHCQDCDKCHPLDMKYCTDCKKCVYKNRHHVSRLGRCLPERYYDRDGYKKQFIEE